MTLRWWTTLVSLALAGCLATPQPDPPSLDPSALSRRTEERNSAVLEGAPGAVDPPGADVWVSPIDRADLPPRTVPSAEDGSFVIALEDGRHRLQPRVGEQRGVPVDVEVAGSGFGVDSPTAACLHTPLEVEAPEVAVGSSDDAVSVRLSNDCGGDVVLAGASMRAASDFVVLEVPERIAPGAEGVVRARFAPSARGLREEILRIDVNGPVAERRAVTLYGRGR